MDAIFFLLGVTAIVVVNSFLALLVGWLLTEVFTLPLKFKPFNCRPCLTFWLTLLLDFTLAWIVRPYFTLDTLTIVYGFAFVGVLAGLVGFLWIKLKYKINE